MPPAWDLASHGLRERNERSGPWPRACSPRRHVLDQTGLSAKAVDTVISVTATGIAVPNLKARLADLLGLRADLRCLPVFGLGCAGGVRGLAHSASKPSAPARRRALQPRPAPERFGSGPSRRLALSAAARPRPWSRLRAAVRRSLRQASIAGPKASRSWARGSRMTASGSWSRLTSRSSPRAGLLPPWTAFLPSTTARAMASMPLPFILAALRCWLALTRCCDCRRLPHPPSRGHPAAPVLGSRRPDP